MAVRYTNLDGSNYNSESVTDADLNDTHNRIAEDVALLGEVKMFALSVTGAITKANLQARNWAICDGSTSLSQGISSATIATTPDLQNRFIRMSDDETSGTEGGDDTHKHTQTLTSDGVDGAGISYVVSGINGVSAPAPAGNTANWDTQTVSNVPAYTEMAFFIKVK